MSAVTPATLGAFAGTSRVAFCFRLHLAPHPLALTAPTPVDHTGWTAKSRRAGIAHRRTPRTPRDPRALPTNHPSPCVPGTTLAARCKRFRLVWRNRDPTQLVCCCARGYPGVRAVLRASSLFSHGGPRRVFPRSSGITATYAALFRYRARGRAGPERFSTRPFFSLAAALDERFLAPLA